MPRYEVNIVYKGQKNYVLRTTSLDEAEDIAANLFKEGDNGTFLGTEYEEIQNVVSKEIEP